MRLASANGRYIYVICSVYVVEDAHRTEKTMNCGFIVATSFLPGSTPGHVHLADHQCPWSRVHSSPSHPPTKRHLQRRAAAFQRRAGAFQRRAEAFQIVLRGRAQRRRPKTWIAFSLRFAPLQSRLVSGRRLLKL